MCSFGGLFQNINRKPRKRKDIGGVSMSLDMSSQAKDFIVRIVHAGGREECYQGAVPAALLMGKYPQMCVARPEVFKNPHESVLLPEEELLPGQKYLLIPSTTAQKLKRKHQEKVKVKETVEGKEEMTDGQMIADVGGENFEESICSAKDFYVAKERWSRCSLKHSGKGKKKPFVPPISKARMHRELGWEPSLTSVQELSP